MHPLAAGIPPVVAQAAIFALVSMSVGALLLASRPRRPGAAVLAKRMSVIAGARLPGRFAGSDTEESRRRQLVEDTLRELQAKQKAKQRKKPKPTLVGRMRQGGVNWGRNTYYLVSATVGIVVYSLLLNTFHLGLAPAVGFGMAAGLALPHLYVGRRRNARLKRFGAEFPNALDVVVRGVKAGLPFVDCLKIIASEAQEPVKAEFKAIVHDQTLGVPVDEAVRRLAERVPLSETNFFSIVITIQARTGGNLSEALGNLSKVLRDRKNLHGKIRAMSAEAKASGAIIAAMPLVVSVLLYFVSPDYIELLFSTTVGHIVLAASGVWMLIGVLVMRKMINFDF